MEEVRLEFADGGIFIRRINQAYFAFNGSYGDAPQSAAPSAPRSWTYEPPRQVPQRVSRPRSVVTSEQELDGALRAVD